ncbi:MAG: two-component regulator propeller domain-containing protein [Ferruginibacter sp.]
MIKNNRCFRALSTKKTLFIYLLTIFIVNVAYTQEHINFTYINSNDGLSSNTINKIIKDKLGLMWFATDDGLNKFDGTKFTIYRNKPSDTNSLRSNEITSLHEDQAGSLWIGTSGGSLSRYNRVLDNFTNYKAENKPSAIRNNVVLSLCSDSQGKIWVGNFSGISILEPATGVIQDFNVNGNEVFGKTTLTLFRDSKNKMWIGTNEGLFVYDFATAKIRQITIDPNDINSLNGNIVKSIAEDQQGTIWLGTKNGLNSLKPNFKNFSNYSYSLARHNSIGNVEVNAISLDNDGDLWIGTSNGLSILNSVSGAINQLSYNKRNTQGLTSRSVRAVYAAEEGIFWIGTFRGGINKYDQNLSLFNLVQSNPFDEKALPAPIVTSFAEAGNNQIYVGTEFGGLALFDQATHTFKRLTIRSRRNNNELIVLSLHQTANQKLLIGTFGEGLFIMDTKSGSYRQLLAGNTGRNINSDEIFSIMEDKSGNFWLGTNGKGITVLNSKLEVTRRYLPKPEFSTDFQLPINGYIRDILQDRQGNFWIATHGGGIAMLNAGLSQFRIYNNANSKLPTDKIQSLLEDRRGNIWVGSFGGGLGLFNPASQQFVTYTEQEGLLNNTVYKIVEDVNGKLWMATNQGLNCFDPQKNQFNSFNYHNGIQRNTFVHGAGLSASNGMLYFGGLDGFNYFNPDYLKRNIHVPKILFTDLKISNQSVAPSANGQIKENISITKEINLDYKQNFALSFVGLNYTAPEQNEYAYKLEGFENEWNFVGNVNSASYTNLDPGEYTFRVRARNNDGVWNNEGRAIKIKVHPPFWRTTYAYILYVLTIAGLMLFSRYKSLQRVKRKFQSRQEKMQVEAERREVERIRELDQQKIKFLTNLSHEFRTPISLIMGPIDSLMHHENGENEQSFGHLNIIKRNARRLLNLVNQLLDFRKMEENEVRLNPTRGEFISFARDVTDSFKDLAERKKIKLVFENHIHSLNTSFDHDKMERILFNLLSNSFKFTLEGGRISVLIQKDLLQSDAKICWIKILVTDTGIGIPVENHQKIFENFYQALTSTEILNQGTGIGLAITKEFVKMQGGSIDVESEQGKGTCFIVQLPFELVAQPVISAPSATRDDATEKTILTAILPAEEQLEITVDYENEPSILLVEDNDDYRYYLKDSLGTHYRVLEASNGKEGWQKALAMHPQLIVSDISMPFMDGIDLCKKIKSDKRTNHIPVILLTALTGENDQLRGLEIGANDYITKPFNVEVLNAKVRNLLTLNNSFKSTYSRQIKVLATEVAIESGDEKLLSDIMIYLEENLTDTQLSVEGLSRHIGMSRSSLYKKLLELTGQTPVEFIRSVKLDKAATLLEKSDMNIAQIAYSVGFATPNYFAKSFKLKFGMLPSDYITTKRNNK